MSRYLDNDYDRVICRVSHTQYELFKRFGTPQMSMGDAVAYLSAYCWFKESSHAEIVQSVNKLSSMDTQVLNKQITVRVTQKNFNAIRDFADAVGWKISRAFVWMAVNGYDRMVADNEDLTHVVAAQIKIENYITI